jgi:hypothetical protein
MTAVMTTARSLLRAQLPRTVRYAGSKGTMLAAGSLPRIPSLAAIICGADAVRGGGRLLPTAMVSSRCTGFAARGGVSLVERSLADAMSDAATNRSIDVPILVDLFRPIPDTLATLHASLRTSTTREDLRRIRKAGFSYRITADPDTVRTFHARYVEPLRASRFPEDGEPAHVEHTLRSLATGGELICLDLDDEWIAGIFNVVHDDVYEIGAVGIRDGAEEIRRRYAISALLVRSFERAVELGRREASLGRSLPFLGKGSVWFKAKWGGELRLNRSKPGARMMLDLRHAPVRLLLAERPVIHAVGSALTAASWLDEGQAALDNTIRDAGRVAGLARWFVLGEPATIAAGRAALDGQATIVPVPVELGTGDRLWLGDVLRDRMATRSAAAVDAESVS